MINWTNPPKDTSNVENWVKQFYLWFVQRTTSPEVPTYKLLKFGTDIPWVGALGPSASAGLYLFKDHNEMVRVQGILQVNSVPAATTLVAGPIPDEYIPKNSLPASQNSIGGWGYNLTSGNIALNFISVSKSGDDWYLTVSALGLINAAVITQVDITYPHMELA